MRVAVGSDHAGFALKELVKQYLADSGIEYEDFGTTGTQVVDYPDYAEKVARAVRDGSADRGILMCGTGVGMCIAANKFEGIRAAAVWDPEIARLSRQHNDANILCLPGRYMDPAFALNLAKIWMDTAFEGGRHKTRVDKLAAIESAALHSHSGKGTL